MSWVLTSLLVFALVFQPVRAQEPSVGKSAQASDIFSGTVVSLTADTVTVVRKVRGEKDVTRTFGVDQKTKVEGKLQVQARITVQWEGQEEDQPRAVHIIVR